jgi:hypothetical protein
MRHRLIWIALLVLTVVAGVEPHAVPTHTNITSSAVTYLKSEAPEFACFSDSDVQIGTSAEDDNPRYMFHFFPALNGPLFTSSCSSFNWGLTDTSVCTQTGAPTITGTTSTLTNFRTWDAAVRNARFPVGSSTQSENGWVDLGYVMHLLEDLTSPAHTRNDAHPPYVDADPVEAQTRNPSMPSSGQLVSYSSPDEFFTSLQAWTQSNFYSKDTCFMPGLPGPQRSSEDSNYFYDAAGNKIAYKSWRWFLSGTSSQTRNPEYTTIDATIAAEQFDRLGSQAVRYTASMMKHYNDTATPLISPVKNGSFETSDLNGWVQDTTFGYNISTPESRTQGNFAARIGRWDQPYQQGGCFRCGPVPGAEPDGIDFIYQDINLPSSGPLTLSFDYNLVTYDGADYDWFDMKVLDAATGAVLATPVNHVGGIIRGSPSNWGEFYTTGWNSVTVDMAAYSGQTVRLMFAVTQDGFGDQIATYIDRVRLNCQ